MPISAVASPGSTARRFQYQSVSRNELRLLRIHGTAQKEPVRLSLTHHDLDCVPEFFALSYVWGDPSNAVQCTCEDDRSSGHLSLTRSLDAILRSIQKHDSARGRLLWIDQICIDQSNNDERSQQVRHMDRIYSLAKKTLISLGPEDDSDRRACRMLTVMAMEGAQQRGGQNSWMPLTRHIVWHWWKLSITSTSSDWDALSKLASKPWFSRLWVLQEFVLSQERVILLAGKEFTWKTFYDAFCYAEESCRGPDSSQNFSSFRDPLLVNAKMKDSLSSFASTLDDLANYKYKPRQHSSRALSKGRTNVKGGMAAKSERSDRGQVSSEVLATNAKLPPEDSEPDKSASKITSEDMGTLYYALGRFGGRAATDTHDKIFALLGISQDVESLLDAVNYNEAIALSLARAMRLVMQQDHDRGWSRLRCLLFVKPATHLPSEPSWLPYSRYSTSTNFGAGNDRRDSLTISGSKPIIHHLLRLRVRAARNGTLKSPRPADEMPAGPDFNEGMLGVTEARPNHRGYLSVADPKVRRWWLTREGLQVAASITCATDDHVYVLEGLRSPCVLRHIGGNEYRFNGPIWTPLSSPYSVEWTDNRIESDKGNGVTGTESHASAVMRKRYTDFENPNEDLPDPYDWSGLKGMASKVKSDAWLWHDRVWTPWWRGDDGDFPFVTADLVLV